MLAKSGEMTLGSPRDRLGENPCFQHTCTQPLAETRLSTMLSKRSWSISPKE
jgi:hypothetical protein